MPATAFTSGLPAFDAAISGILAGDNVVWHVDTVEQYQAFVTPFATAAVRDGRRLIYFRFARHAALLPEDFACETVALRPNEGFEVFIHRIRSVIGAAGLEVCYVFDCLSDLATDWYSDAMLGNFFMLTCPYLFELKTVAYFGLLRRRHTRQATEPVIATTQLFLDVFGPGRRLYVRPVKTQFRQSPTIHLLHVWGADNAFEVVRTSAEIARAFAHAGPNWAASEVYGGELWQRAADLADKNQKPEAGGQRIEDRDQRPEDRSQRPENETTAAAHSNAPQSKPDLCPPASGLSGSGEAAAPAATTAIWHQLVRMVISRDEAILPLVTRYLSLQDLLAIRRRLVGTGLVGGKTVGMLIARNILLRDTPDLAARLEEHDSFYVGSDVFYTFLVRNGLWPHRERQHSPDTFLDGVDEAQELIRAGHFPDYILRQFEALLDYFGPYPFIVRSSSLLEDNYGRAFAGKYESVFCANQGPREERLRAFLNAVRTVYASTMSREALSYRARHGLLERDEQMALLVMRVTGSLQGGWFYPHLAGVGFSYNPFAWHPDIDPAAGVVRLVFGLGTRAVDRVDDDYTRVVALNAPQRRPEADFDDICRHSQRRVDAIDLAAGRLSSVEFDTLLAQSEDVPVELLTTRDDEVSDRTGRDMRVLTFAPLLAGDSPFVRDMRLLLRTLQTAYDRPVDIEFAVNFRPSSGDSPALPQSASPHSNSNYWIHLLQCRPLQVQGTHNPDVPPVGDLSAADTLLRARGAVVGHSRVRPIDWIIHVCSGVYATLGEQDRHAVARAVGQANRALAARQTDSNGAPGGIMAIGPGRWGTHMASLGVPVRFSEINHVSVICELALMHANLTPDVSLGTHFFGEMVEMNILYFGLFPDRPGNHFDPAALDEAPDHFETLTGAPVPASLRGAVRILRASDLAAPGTANPPRLWLLANAPAQEVIVSRRPLD